MMGMMGIRYNDRRDNFIWNVADLKRRHEARLKIVEFSSDDESDRSSFKVVKKCKFAESYLQDFYKHYHPLGIDLFSWCVSDSHIRCYSDNSECHHIRETKSCPNINYDYIVRYRVLPKDSLEVFKKRKLYATEKAKWGDHGVSYLTPSNEERGVQNNWSQRKPCFSLNTNTDTLYQKNIAMPDYENVRSWNESKSVQAINEQGQVLPGILILGGCKRGQIAPPKHFKLASEVSEIIPTKTVNFNTNKLCDCEPYSTLDWTSNGLEKLNNDFITKHPTQKYSNSELRRDFGQSEKSSKCSCSASTEQPLRVITCGDSLNLPSVKPSIENYQPENYGTKPYLDQPSDTLNPFNKLETKRSETFLKDIHASDMTQMPNKDMNTTLPNEINTKEEQFRPDYCEENNVIQLTSKMGLYTPTNTPRPTKLPQRPSIREKPESSEEFNKSFGNFEVCSDTMSINIQFKIEIAWFDFSSLAVNNLPSCLYNILTIT